MSKLTSYCPVSAAIVLSVNRPLYDQQASDSMALSGPSEAGTLHNQRGKLNITTTGLGRHW
jgi:hypothetical protein